MTSVVDADIAVTLRLDVFSGICWCIICTNDVELILVRDSWKQLSRLCISCVMCCDNAGRESLLLLL